MTEIGRELSEWIPARTGGDCLSAFLVGLDAQDDDADD